MFNQFGQRRPFTPTTPARPLGGQPPAGAQTASNGSFGAQIKPDFMQRSGQAGNQQSAAGPSRMQRIKPDDFQKLSINSQRAALFDQARQQAAQAHQASYQTLRNPSVALPGGLSEKQRMDFKMLQRTDPMAAQAKLQQYQRTADIRYNKPGVAPKPAPGSGLTYHRPPSNPTGPSRSFGK
ncbi:hypothetical protein IPL68_03045 [Candidatus Saccharibacteria bacterium]|nr:MAG: hypothetical protein IPL68_03045 [Candidatus Saccharibacteria bacterium]